MIGDVKRIQLFPCISFDVHSVKNIKYEQQEEFGGSLSTFQDVMNSTDPN